MRPRRYPNAVTNVLPFRQLAKYLIRRNSLLPKVGLEPTPTCVDRILSPARLPFRHFGVTSWTIVATDLAG
jgi:hypothetical protein